MWGNVPKFARYSLKDTAYGTKIWDQRKYFAPSPTPPPPHPHPRLLSCWRISGQQIISNNNNNKKKITKKSHILYNAKWIQSPSAFFIARYLMIKGYKALSGKLMPNLLKGDYLWAHISLKWLRWLLQRPKWRITPKPTHGNDFWPLQISLVIFWSLSR